MPKPVNKPIIAVDIDDVLVPHVQDLLRWHNREYGTQMTLNQYRSKDPKDWGAKTIEEAIQRVQKFFVTPDFLEAKPIAEATKVLKKLSDSYDLIVITARDNIIEDATYRWLDLHFPALFKEIHFTARLNLEGGGGAKSTIALAANAKYLIDDALENAMDVSSAGLKVLLFGDYPWNKADKAITNVVRVKDWREVLEYFNEAG